MRPCECGACTAGLSGHLFKRTAYNPAEPWCPDGRRICTVCDEPAIDNDYGAWQTAEGDYYHGACHANGVPIPAGRS